MPRKRTTWVGFAAILLVGIFSAWSLFQARIKFVPDGTHYKIATAGVVAAIAVVIIALSLWYYFNEKT